MLDGICWRIDSGVKGTVVSLILVCWNRSRGEQQQPKDRDTLSSAMRDVEWHAAS